MKFLKRLLFSLLLLAGFSSSAWANLIQLNLTGTMLDASNQNTNDSSATGPHLVGADAYIMRATLASIPVGHSVVYAHFYMWTNRDFQTGLNVYRMVRDFTPAQATWNVASTGVNWGTAGATNTSTDYTLLPTTTYPQQGGNYAEVDITAQVQAAVTGGSGVLDLMLRSATNGSGTIIGATPSSNPPYVIIDTVPTGTFNTWYVRDGGGPFGTVATTCNGTVNATFTGANGPGCALNNPMLVSNGSGINPSLWVGGDTMNINGDSDNSYAFTVSGVTTNPALNTTYTNNGQTFTVTVRLPAGKSSGTITMSGTGAPSASGTLTLGVGTGDATIAFSAEATAQAMYKITSTISPPAGPSLGQQTKILGSGSHYAQLWGANVNILINPSATPNNQDYNHLDLTTHDSCILNGPIGPGTPVATEINADGYAYVCGVGASSTNSITGFNWGGTGLTLENVLVHGFSNGMNNAVPSGPIGNITLTNVKIFGNSLQGAIIGSSQVPGNVTSGTVSEIDSVVEWSGCGQRYPLQDSADIFNNISTDGFSKSIDNEVNYYNCYGQGSNGYGDGYGWGNSGSSNAGNWTIIGSSDSFNVQDGIDTLHGNGNGIFVVARSKFEGNGGQSLKLNGNTIYMENNVVNADCGRWFGAPESSTTQGYLNQHYEMAVSGVTVWPSCNPQAGFSVYTINGINYTTNDCPTSGTSGNIGFTGNVYPNTPPTSGTATKVSGPGDTTITYGSWIQVDKGFNYPDICRAGGDSVVFPMHAGQQVYLYNNTINSNSITIEPGTGSNCDATTIVSLYNNIVNCGGAAPFNPNINGGLTGNEQLANYLYFDGFSGNGGGPCGGPPPGGAMTLNMGNNLVYNCKNSNGQCSSANHDLCQVSPGFTSTYSTGTVSVSNGTAAVTGVGTTWVSSMVGEVMGFGNTSQAAISTWYVIQSVNSPTSITLASNYTGTTLSGSIYVLSIPMGTPSGPASSFYHGTNMSAWINLASTSQARAAANNTLTFQEGTNDFNDFPQTTPVPDIGGLAFGSTFQGFTPNGGACTSNQTCVSNFCVSNVCSSCLINGTSTGNAAQCCSGLAAGGQCVACYPNGNASASASNCCSGFASGGQCVPYVCGDGLITSPEVCDVNGPNLGTQSCQSQGFVGGSLACSPGCLSVDTSSCTNSLLPNGAACTNETQCTSGYCFGGKCATNTGDITTGLQGWWKLDEGSGTTTADSSGNGYTGTLVASPTWVTGRIGPFALSFNGTTQWVSVGNQTNLNFTTASFSYSAWFQGGNGNVGGIIANKGPSLSGYGMFSGSGGAGTVMCKVQDSSNNAIQTGYWSGTNDGNWHQGTCVVDRVANQLVLYGDGQLISSVSISTVGSVSTTSGLYLGAQLTSNNPFAGSVDDARVYNRALTLNDLNTLFLYGCASNSTSCGLGNTCCSSFCSTNQCVPYICGDGLVVSPEVCDGVNLNHQSCLTQGFNGGSLSCNNNCLSFNTSACTGGSGSSVGSSWHGDFATKGQCILK